MSSSGNIFDEKRNRKKFEFERCSTCTDIETIGELKHENDESESSDSSISQMFDSNIKVESDKVTPFNPNKNSKQPAPGKYSIVEGMYLIVNL